MDLRNLIARRRKFGQRIITILIFITMVLIVIPWITDAQGTYTLRWANLSSGYSYSNNEKYALAATGGEVDGSRPIFGGKFLFTGGFWSAVEEPPPMPRPVQTNHNLFLPVSIKWSGVR